MAGTVEKKIINIGGKGSSLSPSNLYAISIAQAQLRLDSSALDRLTSANQNQPRVNIPKTLTPEETRASLTFLLNKLLISGSVSATIPVQISELLNSSQSIDVGSLGFDSSGGEDDSSAVLWGISAVVDHKSMALSTIVDAVAALSCEALNADVAAAFGSMDSGDGFVDRDANGVAGDTNVLLTGSNSVDKVDIEAVNEIPVINGKLRELVWFVHSTIRVELNSAPKVGKGGCGGAAAGRAVGTKLSGLAFALRNLGKNSLSRAKLNVESVSVDSLRSDLLGMFGKACPDEESVENTYKVSREADINRDYVKFVQQVNALIEVVYKVVGWEAITAFFVLEGGELSESGKESGLPNGEDVKADKKSEKKKKGAIGKGASVITQLMKDSFESKGADSLGKQVECLLSFFNPKSPDFVILFNKVKEIVESNESRRLPKLPKGTHDFSNEQMAIREKAFSIVSGVFKRHGGTALDTPTFELRETLMRKYGEDSKLIYDLADQGGELCSLRYDLTVPSARYMAMNGLASMRRYQIAKVYQRDNPSKRECYQCGFVIAGTFEKMGPDYEAIYILTELLDELKIVNYEVKVNHRMLLDGMLAICGVPPEKFRTISSSIDKLDKQDFQQVKKEMVEEKGLTAEVADKIGLYVKEKGHPLELLSKLKQDSYRFLENEDSKGALADLEILFKTLDKAECIDKVVFDLSLARGLDYCTGVIYEAVFKEATQVVSIAGGGRYDKLMGMFGTKPVPAIWVSLDIELVFTIMEQQQKDRNETIRATETEVLVAILGDELSDAAELSGELWRDKLNAEFGVHKNIRKHIDLAIESKIPWMVIEGEQERKQGIVKLKNIETKEEVIVNRERMIEELQTRLK